MSRLLLQIVSIVLIAGCSCQQKSTKGTPIFERTPEGVEKRLKEYLSEEGHGNRGPIFLDLSLGLSRLAKDGRKMKEEEVVKYLGPPDYRGEQGRMKNLLYTYRTTSDERWGVIVHFDMGVMTKATFNAFGDSEAKEWEKFKCQPDSESKPQGHSSQ